MVDLTTRYMGLSLRNPIIAASSGLTSTVESIVDLEKNGAAAVVLKSIFEEEIMMEYQQAMDSMDKYESNLEYFDYYDYKIKEENVDKYIKLIEDAKKAVSIPVIASVNCVSAHEWTGFAKKFEKAGADGLELNIFVLPSDASKTGTELEQLYFEIINKVTKELKIPVAVKLGHYFSGLANTLQKISETDINAMVLFNRSYNPDFDLEKQSLTSSHVLSSPTEMGTTLRWVAIMANRVSCDIAATTGIHDGKGVIKQLLAGANAVQIASTLYKNGSAQIESMLKELETWMDKHNYLNIDQFRGKLSQSKSENAAHYERVQFMRYFSDREV